VTILARAVRTFTVEYFGFDPVCQSWSVVTKWVPKGRVFCREEKTISIRVRPLNAEVLNAVLARCTLYDTDRASLPCRTKI
jgi:hypothetical protein